MFNFLKSLINNNDEKEYFNNLMKIKRIYVNFK